MSPLIPSDGGQAADPAPDRDPGDSASFQRSLPVETLLRDIAHSWVLEAVMEITPDPIYVKDRQRRFVFLNAACARILGLSREELVGRLDSEFLTREDSRHIEEVDARVLTTGETVVAEEPVTEGGTIRIYLSTKSPLLNEKGEIVGLLGISRDITDRKRFEVELQRSEEQLRLAQSAARAGAWTWNPRTGESTWSREGYEICGLDPALHPAAFETWLSVILPEDRAAAEAKFRNPGEGEIRAEYRIRWHNEIRWLLSIGRLMHPEGGSEVVAGVTFDITEQKRTQEALLKQAEAMARSNHELEQFSSVASHDLQEPLRTISLYAQLLERNHAAQLDKRALHLIGVIRDNARRGTELIRSLLAYARSIQPDLEQHGPVNLNISFDQAVSNLILKISEGGASVTRGELPTVIGDPIQATLIFQNLIENALKYRSDAPPVVKATAERWGNEWLIRVADNGRGIPRESWASVFEPFRRLEDRGIPGTGIGLTTCKRVVEQFGGRIWVESEPGVGSTFLVALPAAQ